MPVGKKLVLDANLLLLLTIGLMDRSEIVRFKRTNRFTIADFDALTDIVANAQVVITTPHILTEVSNLANSLREDQKKDFAHSFREVIKNLDERSKQATVLSEHTLFPFGITDVAALTESTGALLLTEDGRFASQVNLLGGFALSLNGALAIRSQEV